MLFNSCLAVQTALNSIVLLYIVLRRIIDVFNSMQGLLIFLLLVVLRKRVIKLMLKKGWLACISGFVEKHLALKDDEENVVQHTDIPMSMSNRNTNEDGL